MAPSHLIFLKRYAFSFSITLPTCRIPILILFKGPSEGLFTEGCFVLVEGDYSDEETLVVIAIGHPPSERRAAAR